MTAWTRQNSTALEANTSRYMLEILLSQAKLPAFCSVQDQRLGRGDAASAGVFRAHLDPAARHRRRACRLHLP